MFQEFTIKSEKVDLHAEIHYNTNYTTDDQFNIDKNGIAVVCHGLLCTTRTRLMIELKDYLISQTCNKYKAVVLFDFRGNGNSSGSTSYANYMEESRDLKAVKEYVDDNFSVKYGKVDLIIGHSKGASVVLIYACLNGYDGGGIVLMSGRFDMGIQPKSRFTPEQLDQLKTRGHFKWKTYRRSVDGNDGNCDYIVTREDMEIRSKLNMAEYCKGLKCRVLILHGKLDTVVPCQDAEKYHEQISGNCSECNLVLLDDSVDHFYSSLDSALLAIKSFITTTTTTTKIKVV